MGLPPHPQDLIGVCKTINLLLIQNLMSCSKVDSYNYIMNFKYSKPIKISSVVLGIRRKRE